MMKRARRYMLPGRFNFLTHLIEVDNSCTHLVAVEKFVSHLFTKSSNPEKNVVLLLLFQPSSQSGNIIFLSVG